MKTPARFAGFPVSINISLLAWGSKRPLVNGFGLPTKIVRFTSPCQSTFGNETVVLFQGGGFNPPCGIIPRISRTNFDIQHLVSWSVKRIKLKLWNYQVVQSSGNRSSPSTPLGQQNPQTHFGEGRGWEVGTFILTRKLSFALHGARVAISISLSEMVWDSNKATNPTPVFSSEERVSEKIPKKSLKVQSLVVFVAGIMMFFLVSGSSRWILVGYMSYCK